MLVRHLRTGKEACMRHLWQPLAVLAAVALFASGLTNAALARSGTERFSLIDTSTASHPSFSVIATGMITAGGTAAEKKTPVKEFDPSVPGWHDHADPEGKHRRAGPLGPPRYRPPLPACRPTTPPRTTRSRAGQACSKESNGSGTTTRSETFVEAASSGNCANNFLAIQAVISASGPVSLP